MELSYFIITDLDVSCGYRGEFNGYCGERRKVWTVVKISKISAIDFQLTWSMSIDSPDFLLYRSVTVLSKAMTHTSLERTCSQLSFDALVVKIGQ